MMLDHHALLVTVTLVQRSRATSLPQMRLRCIALGQPLRQYNKSIPLNRLSNAHKVAVRMESWDKRTFGPRDHSPFSG